MSGAIAYQGEAGANSHVACLGAYPGREVLPCATFEEALASIREGRAELGMIPVENSVAGRVADVHHLLPESGLYIVAEHFERVHHQLLALPGAPRDGLQTAHSHTQALGQCRLTLQRLGLTPVVEADTAGSARMVAEGGDPTRTAIASRLAAAIYGLEIVQADIQDAVHNTTRFLILSRHPSDIPTGAAPVKTTLVFRVRNVPAALYKALGGFATNGVNLTKLESYQLEGSFSATMFYVDIDGHPADRLVALAIEELAFHAAELRILGTYPARPLPSREAVAA